MIIQCLSSSGFAVFYQICSVLDCFEPGLAQREHRENTIHRKRDGQKRVQGFGNHLEPQQTHLSWVADGHVTQRETHARHKKLKKKSGGMIRKTSRSTLKGDMPGVCVSPRVAA